MIGALGGNVSADQLIARASGQILNPNLELLFNGVGLRVFPFSFQFFPRSKEEADEVMKIVPKLMKDLSYSNLMQVPKIEKICLSQGVGSAVNDKKLIDSAVDEMTKISGQKSLITRSKKDVANFKLRKGMPIGVKVTLRKSHMCEFIDRLINVALPRVRDFRGLNGRSFDGNGNYSLGLKEQIVFPEIDYDNIDTIRGMDICVVTSAKSDEEGKELLKNFDFPFIN